MLAQLGAPGTPGGPVPTAGPPVPARLRRVTATGQGDWLAGALRLTPGSLLWEPAIGVSADAVELATAMVVPAPAEGRRGKQALVTDLQTPAGQFQLELDPVLFGMSQELVAEEAAKRGQPPGPGFG